MDINIKTIKKVLTQIRICFARYIKDYYKFNKLGRESGGSNISKDESTFIKINAVKVWVIEARNIKT